MGLSANPRLYIRPHGAIDGAADRFLWLLISIMAHLGLRPLHGAHGAGVRNMVPLSSRCMWSYENRTRGFQHPDGNTWRTRHRQSSTLTDCGPNEPSMAPAREGRPLPTTKRRQHTVRGNRCHRSSRAPHRSSTTARSPLNRRGRGGFVIAPPAANRETNRHGRQGWSAKPAV
jgi:hypothetical protein